VGEGGTCAPSQVQKLKKSLGKIGLNNKWIVVVVVSRLKGQKVTGASLAIKQLHTD